MDETLTQKLTAALEALNLTIARMDAQQEALSAKVDRIVSAVEERPLPAPDNRVAELERANAELKAQAARAARKTLSPLVSVLLAKNGLEDPGATLEPAALDKALRPLSLEQRIAVKAEMARAGLIE